MEDQTPFITLSRQNVSAVNAAGRKLDPAQSWPASAGSVEPAMIRPGDRIMVTIWDSEPNSLITTAQQRSAALQTGEVDAEGAIYLPYIGRLDLSGLKAIAALERVQDAFRTRVPTAEVQLAVQPGSRNSVQLVQGVQRPGLYPAAEGASNVLAALALAGGINPALRNPVVRLIRDGRSFDIRAEALFEGRATDLALRGGDKLLVTEDPRSFTVLGATSVEKVVAFDREAITALEALAMASGLADHSANPKSILVLRTSPSGAHPHPEDRIYAIDMTTPDGLFAARSFLVRDGDTLLATEAPLSATRTVLQLVGSMVGITNAVTR